MVTWDGEGRTNIAKTTHHAPKVNHCLARLQTAKDKTRTFLFHYLSFILEHMMWNIIFISFGQLSWLCSLPASCPFPASLLWDVETEKEKALVLCKHRSAIAKTLVCYKHCCVINTALITNPGRIIKAAMKKIIIPSHYSMCRDQRQKKWNAYTTSSIVFILE